MAIAISSSVPSSGPSRSGSITRAAAPAPLLLLLHSPAPPAAALASPITDANRRQGHAVHGRHEAAWLGMHGRPEMPGALPRPPAMHGSRSEDSSRRPVPSCSSRPKPCVCWRGGSRPRAEARAKAAPCQPRHRWRSEPGAGVPTGLDPAQRPSQGPAGGTHTPQQRPGVEAGAWPCRAPCSGPAPRCGRAREGSGLMRSESCRSRTSVSGIAGRSAAREIGKDVRGDRISACWRVRKELADVNPSSLQLHSPNAPVCLPRPNHHQSPTKSQGHAITPALPHVL